MYLNKIVLVELCQVDLFDQVPRSKISTINKPEAFAFKAVAERVEGAVNNETLMPKDFRAFFI